MGRDQNGSADLTALFLAWQADTQRVQMALQTLTGAQGAAVASEVAFKAAATLQYGPDATWEFDQTKRKLKFKRPTSRALARRKG
jgi:hypothetical protein